MLESAIAGARPFAMEHIQGPAMPTAKPLEGCRILIFVADEYEDLELWYPKLRLEEAGAQVTLAGPEVGKTYRGKHGYPCPSDAAIGDMQAADFEGVLCPGGWMPDKIRRDSRALSLVRECAESEKLVAAICHGGWIPISAGVYRGVKVTGSPGIKDDLVNAGAIWQDSSLVVDRHFVSSRKPADLPDFMTGVLRVLSHSAKAVAR
jgi:protease I